MREITRSTKSKITDTRPFLYATEFISGISVMAVELGASRLLAPYFSSSQIVWTIIIGTIMIAMALGNVYGGRSADKDANPAKLYARLLVASVWIALIPAIGKYIIIGISGVLIFSINSHFLIWAAFASCMIIFVFPLFLLGTVTPSLAKYCTQSLDDNGKVIGSLGAFNTIGSIIGTFVPTFITIPAVGTAMTFYGFAGLLFIVCAIFFISEMTRSGIFRLVASALIFIISMIFGAGQGFAFWETDLTYEGESVYNYLQVKDYGNLMAFSTNVVVGVQSLKVKDDSLVGFYYDYALAAPLMTGKEDLSESNALILGMGMGTYATQLDKYYGMTDVVGVEIDKKIIDLSREYFDLPESVEVVEYDGRAYLDASDKKYDVIMVDAYQDITIPFQMSSVEFFTSVKEHLTEDGVMVVNLNMTTDDADSINYYLCDTIDLVFGDVYTIDVGNATNRELFASNSDKAKANLDAKLKEGISSVGDVDLYNQMTSVQRGISLYEGGERIFTDDKAPVELLGMRTIDDLIIDEVGYYKDIYEKEGIKGLIEELS